MRLLLTLALALPLAAQDWRWIHAGVVAHALGSAADGWSSWGREEANPILAERGRFQHRAVAIKAAEFGVTTAATYLIGRKQPKLRRLLGIVNLGMGTTYGAVAGWNWRSRGIVR
jgi:hypothetical protein